MKKVFNLASSFTLIFLMLQTTNCTQPKESFGGLALYTLREEMAAEPKEVLRKVADIGYAYVEAAGYEAGKFYGMEPEAFKNHLKELGLVPLSSHHSGITFENADQTIADVKAVGFEYLVIPIPPMGLFQVDPETKAMGMTGGVENLTQIINTIAEKCHAAGLKLLYHNHDFELRADEAGIVPLDYLLEHTDPNLVNFELDLYWAVKAGADPVAYFEKYPGRFKIWHVKDMDEQGRFAPVGQGTIDFARILAAKDQAGMEHYFVEQDQTFDLQPLEAIAVSREGLAKFGFR